MDELVWIDCEMTGLDLRSDRLIEIAALVTDAELNVLGEGVDVVIHADDAALDGMVEVVARLHARSGLTEEVRVGTSGYRTPRRNATLRGAARESQHIFGRAVDLGVDGLPGERVAEIAEAAGAAGIGLYERFTHIDVGREGRRWGA